MASIHQVNHPGQELNISYRNRHRHQFDYYFLPNSTTEGVRLWSRCFVNGKANSHKRKFIEHNGKYVEDLNSKNEKSGLLRFWGEYEGHSRFELLSQLPNLPYMNNPNAIHKPFFCMLNKNDQNTDPYIFGENFYYAICKKNQLKNIHSGDIILFGSEFGSKGNVKFHLDTLFVVEKEQDSVICNDVYDSIYMESTLKRIGLSCCTNGNLPIHIGSKFSSKGNIFSFFPAKTANDNIFGRPIIDTENLGLQKPGARTGAKSREISSDESIINIWRHIANSVLKQGFSLGTHADELITLPSLP
jgi:hypothetical protein